MPPIDAPAPDHSAVVDSRVEVADGVFLHVRSRPGSATPFLLVHGLSSNARLWDTVAADLAAAGHPSLAVDLRSHGESDTPPSGYDTATAVADLATLSFDRAIVAGQSWGGNVAVALAAGHPDRVAALALVDGGWIDLPAQFESWAACEEALRPPDIDGLPAATLAGYLREAHPDWSPEAIEATMANLRTWPDGTLTRRLAIPAHLSILRSMWDDPPQRHYASIVAPTLLLTALPADPEQAADRLGQVQKVAAALPDAAIHDYPGADHDLHAQHPHEVAADLLRLAALVGP